MTDQPDTQQIPSTPSPVLPTPPTTVEPPKLIGWLEVVLTICLVVSSFLQVWVANNQISISERLEKLEIARSNPRVAFHQSFTDGIGALAPQSISASIISGGGTITSVQSVLAFEVYSRFEMASGDPKCKVVALSAYEPRDGNTLIMAAAIGSLFAEASRQRNGASRIILYRSFDTPLNATRRHPVSASERTRGKNNTDLPFGAPLITDATVYLKIGLQDLFGTNSELAFALTSEGYRSIPIKAFQNEQKLPSAILTEPDISEKDDISYRFNFTEPLPSWCRRELPHAAEGSIVLPNGRTAFTRPGSDVQFGLVKDR